MSAFSIESFVRLCKSAMASADNREEAAYTCLRETIESHSPAEIIDALEAAIPPGASVGEMIVHASPELTVLYARIPARFQAGIHNHTVFASIAQLRGRERNIFFEEDGDSLRETGRQTVNVGEVIFLPANAIHSIENPDDEGAAALHIYGGDFRALMDERSLWDSHDHSEIPFSFPNLLEQSVKAMRSQDNERGLQALVEAIPASRPMVENAQN